MTPKNDMMMLIVAPAIAGVGCILLAMSAVNAIAAMADLRPQIGDIVSFTPSADQTAEGGGRLIVRRSDQIGCVLDVGSLRHLGGSFVVEGQIAETAGSFRVHWAGDRTSADNANCGAQSDLILDGHELNVLAFGAGGYGAGDRKLPALVSHDPGI
jgi:hypothetical protein